MIDKYHVIVVGSGVAGLAAAAILSGHGLKILVIDDNAHVGGQLLRNLHNSASFGKRFEPDRLKRQGIQLVSQLKNGKVPILNGAQVLGVYPERMLLVEDNRGRVSEYYAQTLILATGARERQLPFRGWTLPGVMATGAAQILIKNSGILPGRKTLIGGCSPLMLVLAAEILTSGGEVLAVLDQSLAAEKLKAFNAGTAIWPKLLEGASNLARLFAARVPIKQGVRIVEARGRQQLEDVVVARVHVDGRIIRGTEKIYATDTLAVGYGFSPNIELPLQAGCVVKFSAAQGGWFVDVNNTMATTVDNIYAVGETTGIAGAGKSFIEGRIAGWAILNKQGIVDPQTYETKTRPLIRQRLRHVQYGHFLNQLCRPQTGCYADIPDNTVICRCEEVTMGDIRRQLKNDFTTMNSIKKATRCSMGNCQGRTCGPILFDILSSYMPRPPDAIGCPSSRVPVKKVALGALAEMTTRSEQNGGNFNEN